MERSQQQSSLLEDSGESDLISDAPAYMQVTHHWVVMRQANTWRPPTDVFELGDRLVVMVEIAGMRDGEWQIALEDRRLIIGGLRKRLVRDRMAFHQMEVRYGEFRTVVNLPWPVDRQRVAATYKDGFLRVDLPRARNQQVHIVNVDVEDHNAD